MAYINLTTGRITWILGTTVLLGLWMGVVNAQVNQEACYLPEESGNCLALIPRYHYNVEADRCNLFSYGGCNGNANNFKSEAECLRFRNFCVRHRKPVQYNYPYPPEDNEYEYPPQENTPYWNDEQSEQYNNNNNNY